MPVDSFLPLHGNATKVFFVGAAEINHLPSPLGQKAGWFVCRSTDVNTIIRTWSRLLSPVVVCSSDTPGLDWRELCQEFLQQLNPPAFIVCSRLADESLWLEALSLGASDVIRLPLDLAEFQRSVNLASPPLTARSSSRPLRARAIA